MQKLYQYTIFRQDGSIEELAPCPKKHFEGVGGLYELLGCNIIEIVPKMYYDGKDWGRCTVYVDEEGRDQIQNHRNPHFMSFLDSVDDFEYDVVGDAVREKVAK